MSRKYAENRNVGPKGVTRRRRTKTNPGKVACLKCGAMWNSPDVKQWRICPTCTRENREEWTGEEYGGAKFGLTRTPQYEKTPISQMSLIPGR